MDLEHAIDAARQLHRDVCLMTTNLNILDQYVLCLQVSVHMEAMSLWRPLLDPAGYP